MPRRFARENFPSGRRRRPISSSMLKVPIYIITDTVNEHSSITIFISFFWDPSKNIEIAFKNINNYTYHPRFGIRNTNLQILDGLMNQEITIPTEFHNKQIMLWIARNKRIAKMSLSNYSGILTTNTKRNFYQSKKLNIDCTNIHV